MHTLPGMSRLHRTVNLAAVVLPLVAFVVAIALLWNTAVGWSDLVLLGVLYVFTGLGITIGYHRMLTHRAFETSPWLRNTFAIMGSMAVEGSAITWVADHRKHHTFTDEEGDPHSPHGHGGGLRGAVAGLAHAHIGWLFNNVGQADPERYAPDLCRNPAMRKIDHSFFRLAALSLLIPFALGWLITGRFTGALTGLLWGGLVRVFLLHHMTWSINSVCHFFGRRRFDTDDQSTNVIWLALPTFGEAWHHNHHAFPTSAFHGLRAWERAMDPAGLVLMGLEKVGLIWDVKRVPVESQAAKAMRAAA